MRRLLIALMAAVLLVGGAAVPAQAGWHDFAWEKKVVRVCKAAKVNLGVNIPRSVREWNKGSDAIDIRYVRYCKGKPGVNRRADIVVHFRWLSDVYGYASPRRSGDALVKCRAYVDNSLRHSWVGSFVVSHELGHCLGIAHNNQSNGCKWSVMRHGYCAAEGAPPWPTRHDEWKLRVKYGGSPL